MKQPWFLDKQFLIITIISFCIGFSTFLFGVGAGENTNRFFAYGLGVTFLVAAILTAFVEFGKWISNL